MVMNNDNYKKEAAEIRKLPISVLEYLPHRRWMSLSALIVVVVVLLVIFGQNIYTNIKYARLEAELNRYENLWQSKEISSYEYTLRAWVYGEYSEASVRVEDGIAISEELANNGWSSLCFKSSRY